jgi:integrase/recombinase XerD
MTIPITRSIESFVTSRQLGRSGGLRVHQMWLDLWQRWRSNQPDGLAAVTADELRGFFVYLANEYRGKAGAPPRQLAPASRRSAWRSLRAYWRFCADEGWLSPDQRTFFPRRIPEPVVEEEPRPAVSWDMIEQLLAAAETQEDPFKAVRDVALIWLLWESGARASEACSIRLDYVDAHQRRAAVRGKGGRWGWLMWGEQTAVAVHRYRLWRPIADHSTLFVGIKQPHAALTYNALRLSLTRLAAAHHIDLPTGATIHGFRHGFAHRMLDAGVDGLHLQQLMRHRSIDTTARYVREHAPQLQAIHAAALKQSKQ